METERIKLKCPKCKLETILRIDDLPKVALGKAYLIPWSYLCTTCYTKMELEQINEN